MDFEKKKNILSWNNRTTCAMLVKAHLAVVKSLSPMRFLVWWWSKLEKFYFSFRLWFTRDGHAERYDDPIEFSCLFDTVAIAWWAVDFFKLLRIPECIKFVPQIETVAATFACFYECWVLPKFRQCFIGVM